jgi:hypothetical protein
VFAAGDNVRGPASLVEAIADARKSAMAIDKYLGGKGEFISPFRDKFVGLAASYDYESYQVERKRAVPPHLPVDQRLGGFAEVVAVYPQEEAVEEARRCLRCYLKEEE